jgi:hypothetical protein
LVFSENRTFPEVRARGAFRALEGIKMGTATVAVGFVAGPVLVLKNLSQQKNVKKL